MNRSWNRISALVVAASALLFPLAGIAQIPGENVNMVTGTQWPGGDPFLQRQNEPSLAVSSANPQHLLAGANDYRSVDVPYPLDLATAKMPGDAWLGVFKSMNGGQTWQSVLMPGFPQDNSTLPSQGARSPLRNCVKGSTALADRCTSAADPVVRAGTDGMLYYSGIAFKRGTAWGKVFLSRFIDLNNKENGDPTRTDPADPTKANPTDPIRFVDQVVIASSDGKSFLDKPWIAVDRPRLLAQTCKVTATNPDGTTTTRAFPGGAIYASWIRFAPGEVTSDVMFSSSRDCGKTWTAAIKLNDGTSTLNQAPSIAIDPFTGFVYVAWRRMAYPAKPAVPTQKDAIMVARSFRGFLFTKPRVIAEFRPFEQYDAHKRFRTYAFPSIAISVDKTGYNGWVHVAWPQRMGEHGDSRVVTSTAPVLPPPFNGLESSDACNGWTVPVPVDDHAVTEAYGEGTQGGWRTFTRGHQFMPSLTFSQGKLVVLYYDSRLTHTASVHRPNDPFLPDAFGSFYRSERVPITPWDPRTRTGEPEDPSRIFRATDDEIDDTDMLNVRHTIEVRVGTSPPGKDPIFSSVQVSSYRFGERGDEPPHFRVPQFLGTDSSSYAVSSRDGGLPITTLDGFLRLQQFDVNAPNLPMFKNGTLPFIGDYIDVQGLAFVRKPSGWAFASEPVAAPVFHAVWASNQDVRSPADGDWTRYTPMKLPGQGATIFDGATASTVRDYCTPGTPSNEGIRNQNVYTARITQGLLVGSPQNVKPLSSSQTRSFVVVARNDTAYPKAFRFGFTGIAPASCAVATGQAGPTSCATFSADGSVPAVDVEILPHSSATRSLFVRSTSPATTISVNVNEVVRPDPAAPRCSLAALDCGYVTGGLSGFVTLNPPGSSPSLVAPDGSATGAGTNETITFANVSTANVSTANVSTANVSTANVSTANISTANVSTANVCTANVSTANVSTANVCTANVSTANVSTANVSTANVTTANISTANVSTANVSTANVSTANVSTANVSTANVSTANVSTANVSTAAVSDLNYEVTNTSNTTTSYSVQFVCADPAGCPTEPLHLMVNKFYVIPASVGCQLVAEPRPVLVANGGYVQDALVNPGSLIDPKTREGQASNATVSLAPGEKAQITLRGRIPLAEMAALGTRIVPAVLPHSTPRGGTLGGTQTYASTTTFGLPSVTTQTTVTASGNTYTATVVGVPASAGIPTGKVTFISGGTALAGVGPLDATGKAVLTATLPAGASLVAYYGGDSRFKASSGAWGQRATTSLTVNIDATPPSVPGQPVTVGFALVAQALSPFPTGRVQVYDGDVPVGDPSSFVCTTLDTTQRCTGSFTDVPGPGNHSYWAEYAGDAAFLGAVSSSFPWSVASATVVVSGPATALIGQPVPFSALVTNATSQSVRWDVTTPGAEIGPDGTFVASAPGIHVVTATSLVDPGAVGTSTIAVATPTVQVSPGGPDTIGLTTAESVTLFATVTGFATPVVTWTLSPPTVGATITPSADTLSATFASTVTGNFTVTASAGGATSFALFNVVAAASPFGITGAVNDGFVNVGVAQDFAAYNDATVTVTGAGGVSYPVPRVGNGQYQTTSYALPAVGQAVTVTVSGGGQTATATALVPERPVITAPAQGSILLAADPITVTWTSTTSPDDYAFDGWCGNGQCVAGAWTTVVGTTRSFTFNGGFFPVGQTVSMGLYAFNRMALSGAALPASSLIVNNKAPTPATWWTFLVTETAAGRLVVPRRDHVSVLVGGAIYSVGGTSTGNAIVASVERFDPVTGTSRLVAPMLEGRTGHAAVALGGRIYAIGGVSATGQYLSSVEAYDPATNAWTPISPLPVARTLLRAAVLGGRIHAIGGFSQGGAPDRVDVYDPATGTWSFLGYLGASRAGFALGEADGKLYAIGGVGTVDGLGVTSVEVIAGAAPGTLLEGVAPVDFKGLSAASANGLVYVVGAPADAMLLVFDPVSGIIGYPAFSWFSPGPGAPLYANPFNYSSSVTDGTNLWVTGGQDRLTAALVSTITQVPLPPAFTAPAPAASTIAAGGSSSFFVEDDGTAWSLGQNHGGQLGSGLPIGQVSTIPSPLVGIPAGVRWIDAAAWYGMAIDRLGSLWAWGWGPSIGQPSNDNPLPIEYGTLGTGTTVTAISAGYNGGVAVRSDGAVFGFGNDTWGQLGPPAGHAGVRQIPGLAGIVAVAAGERHTLALGSDGTVWTLGDNTFGQLGDGTITPSSAPRRVAGLSQIVAIAAGSWHSVALRVDGAVLTWGNNEHGQLGDGTTVNSPVPTRVLTPYLIDGIATGNNHTLALSEGGVGAWGANAFGQVGDGSTIDRTVPVWVGGVPSAREVSGGEWHSMARGASGAVYTWGSNGHGQLGAAAPVVSPAPATFPLMAVSVSPASASAVTGQQVTFTAAVTGIAPSGRPPVTGVWWSVSPAAGATISEAGVFQASEAGTYTVTAYSLDDGQMSASATVTVTVPPVLQLNGTVGIASASGASPYRSFTMVVSDGNGQPVPSQELTVTLGSSSSPGNAVNIPAYLPAGQGYFSASGLPIAPGDTVTVEVVRSASGFEIGRTTGQVVVPGVATLTSGTAAGGSAVVAWSYSGAADPQAFWFWVTGQATVPSAAGILRATTFPVTPAPPFGVKVTSVNWTGTFTGIGSGVFTARTDDDVSYTVTAPAPVTVTVDPPTASLAPGASMGFVAVVTGTANPAVTWSVQEAGGGTIDAGGSYTAPATAGTYHVVAMSVADPAVSGSATVTVTAPAAAPLLDIGGFAGVTREVSGPPTTSVYLEVMDTAGVGIPTAELTVTLTSSANPGNPVSVPADTIFNQPGVFRGSGLPFSAGDVLTLEVVRTNPATSAVIAQATAQVQVPAGVASLTSASFLGGSVTTQWDYPAGATEPQTFDFWWPGSDVPEFPVLPGTSRSATFAIDVLPPVDLWITSYNGSTAFTGNGTGQIWGYTDEAAGFPVTDLRGAAPSITVTSSPTQAGHGPGYTVTLTARVEAGTGSASLPSGNITFTETLYGGSLGSAPLSRPCGAGAMCADLSVASTAFDMPPAANSRTYPLVAEYAGDVGNQAATGSSGTPLGLHRPQIWHALTPFSGIDPGLVAIGDRIFTIGGSGFSTTSDAILAADAGVGAWTPVGTLPAGSSRMAAASGGKVYVFTAASPPQEFDPATGLTTVLANPMPTPRSEGAAVALPDGRILVVGGTGSSGAVSAAAEIFDPATGQWSSAPSMPTARSWCNAVLAEGKVFVVGGVASGAHLDSVEYLDLTSGTWTSGPPLLLARRGAAAAYAAGKIYVAGGSVQPTVDGSETATVEQLDVASLAGWAAAPAIGDIGRAGLAAVTLPANGGIYVVGGVNQTESYTLETLLFFP